MEPAKPRVVAFGEIMLRLSPPGHERFQSAKLFEAAYGGAEANVAVTLANLGISSRFVTALPTHEVGQAAVNAVRAFGVDTSYVLRTGERVGIYYLEQGASQRGSNVIYDRAGSSIAGIDAGVFDWDAIFAGAEWFHFSGITPALSPGCARAVKEAAVAAKGLGLTVSCDLNYRKKLWTKQQAMETMEALMAHVDLCMANEEDAEVVFGIRAEGTHVEAGQLDQGRYEAVAKEMSRRFGFRGVAISLRESFTASRNGWSGMLFAEGHSSYSRRYEIDIVDRIGAGDSFAAGVIYGLLSKRSPQETVEFAAAAGCLAHSVPGDFGIFSEPEITALLSGDGSGRVKR